MALKEFKTNDNRIVDSNGKTNKAIVNSSINNKSRNLMYMPNIEAMRELIFLTSNVEKAFNYLKLTFIKALIF